MPWPTKDKGDGWATRRIPGVRRTQTRARVVILFNGEPVDRADKEAVANARIKKYRQGELPMPSGVVQTQSKGSG